MAEARGSPARRNPSLKLPCAVHVLVIPWVLHCTCPGLGTRAHTHHHTHAHRYTPPDTHTRKPPPRSCGCHHQTNTNTNTNIDAFLGRAVAIITQRGAFLKLTRTRKRKDRKNEKRKKCASPEQGGFAV